MQRCRIFPRLHSKHTYRVLAIFLLFLISLNFVPLPVPIPTSTTSKAWWDSSWQYYRVCNIDTNGYSGYYQMKINVSYNGGGDVSCNGHCQSDFDDIRFVDIDNSTVLPYWKETYVDSQYAIFWVNVSADAMSDGKILMYYGNPSATDASDGDETFIEFASWENSLEGWTDTSSGSGSVSFTSTDVTPIDGNYALKLNCPSGGNQAKVERDGLSISGDVRLLYFVATPGGAQAWFTTTYDTSDLRFTMIRTEYGGYDGLECMSGSTHITLISSMTAYHLYRVYAEIDMSADKYNVDIDNGEATANNNNFRDTGTADTFDRIVLQAGSSSDEGVLYVDALCVMKGAVGNEPTWSSFGSEQSQGGWTNTPPAFSNESPQNASANVPIKPWLSVNLTDADGNSTDWWLWTSEDGGVTWTLRANGTAPDGNTTITYHYVEANSPSTTYYWKVAANDSHDNTTRIYHFTTWVIGTVWTNESVSVISINNSTVWRMVWHAWDGEAFIKDGWIITPIAKEYDTTSSYCGYIVFYNISTGEKGVVNAINNANAASHTGGDIYIDKDGYIWFFAGGYADDEPLTLYKSNASYDFYNFTAVATVSTTGGGTAPAVAGNDTYIICWWRNGANDNPSTPIAYKRYWTGNGSLESSGNVAVGDTATNCYSTSLYDLDSDSWFLSWSYKIGTGKWGSFPFIKVSGIGNSYLKSNDSAYTLTINYSECDRIRDSSSSFDDTFRVWLGTLNGKNCMVVPYNVDNSTDGIANRSIIVGVRYSETWQTVWLSDKINFKSYAPLPVGIGKYGNYLIIVYPDEGLHNISMIYSNDGLNWSDPIKLIEENTVVTGISVAQVYDPDFDNDTLYFYYTVNEEENMDWTDYNRFKRMDNVIRLAAVDLSQYLQYPPNLTNPSAVPSSGVADYTIFYFNVTYSDPDGDPPAEIKVNISKLGWYLNATMTYVSGDNETGALYSYNTTLPAGTYDYLFYASDGTYSTVNNPTDQIIVEEKTWQSIQSGWCTFSNSSSWHSLQQGWVTFSNQSSWQSIQSGWATFSNQASWQSIQSGWVTFSNQPSWNSLESGWVSFSNQSSWNSLQSGWVSFSNSSSWHSLENGWVSFSNTSTWHSLESGWVTFGNITGRTWHSLQSGWCGFSNSSSWHQLQSGWSSFSNISSWHSLESGWVTFSSTERTWHSLESGWVIFGNQSNWHSLQSGWVSFSNYTSSTSNITFGSEYVFREGTTSWTAVANLTTNKVVVCFYDDDEDKAYARIGTISNDSISWGDTYEIADVYISGNTLGVTALSEDKFVVCYRGSDMDGYVKVGTVSGTTISFGSAYKFYDDVDNDGDLHSAKVTKLNSTKFVVAYGTYADTNYGGAKVGEVSGTTVSFGSEYTFHSGKTYYVSVTSLTSSKIAVGYRENYPEVCIGEISDTTINFGNEYTIETVTAEYIDITKLTPSKFIYSYNDYTNSKGKAVVGTVSGTSVSFGSVYVFNTGDASFTSLVSLNESTVVVSYQDHGNSYYGTSLILEISGTTIQSIGDETIFNTARTPYIDSSFLTNTKFIVTYQDYGNSRYGTAIIGITKQPPTISNPQPPNGATNVPVTLSQLSVEISDPEGDLMDWTIETSPNIGSASGNNAEDGTITCLVSNLTYGTTYTWYVNVTDGNSWTNETYTFTTESLDSPSNLKAASIDTTTISLTWTKGSNADTTVIVRKTGSYPTGITDGVVVYNDTGTSYTDSSLSAGTGYYYRAWSYANGEYSSSYDSAMNYTYPDKPISISSSATAHTISLSWTKGAGADKTVIRYSTSGYPTSPSDGTLAYNGTDTSTTISGLASETTYYFSFWAYDSESGYYSQDYATHTATTPYAPPDPSNLMATPINTTAISLTWSASTDVNSVLVRKTGGYPSSPSDGTVIFNSSGTSYTDTGLTPSTHYYYRVWTYDQGVYSENYAQDDAWTKPQPPQDVNYSLETSGTTANLTITWTKGQGADKTVVRKSANTFPSSPSDGTLVYNGTGTECTDANIDQMWYYRLWSYNESSGLYSDAVNLTFFACWLNCYNESSGEPIENWSVFISDMNGSQVYSAENLQNSQILNTSQLPSGLASFKFTADGYKFRLYYYEITPETSLTINAYLPPESMNTTLYLLYVKDVFDSPIRDALISVRHYDPSSGEYVEVARLYTDAEGRAGVYLIPGDMYKLVISKEGYQTGYFDYTPLPEVYTAEFTLLGSGEGTELPEGLWDNITLSIRPSQTHFNTSVNLTVYFNISCSTGELEWYRIEVYKIRNLTQSETLLYSNNETNPYGGNLSYNIGSEVGTYKVVCTFKKQNFSAVSFEKLYYIYEEKLPSIGLVIPAHIYLMILIFLALAAMAFLMRLGAGDLSPIAGIIVFIIGFLIYPVTIAGVSCWYLVIAMGIGYGAYMFIRSGV